MRDLLAQRKVNVRVVQRVREVALIPLQNLGQHAPGQDKEGDYGQSHKNKGLPPLTRAQLWMDLHL